MVTTKQLKNALSCFPEDSIINIIGDGEDTENYIEVYKEVEVEHQQPGLKPIGCIVIIWSNDDPIEVQIY